MNQLRLCLSHYQKNTQNAVEALWRCARHPAGRGQFDSDPTAQLLEDGSRKSEQSEH